MAVNALKRRDFDESVETLPQTARRAGLLPHTPGFEAARGLLSGAALYSKQRLKHIVIYLYILKWKS